MPNKQQQLKTLIDFAKLYDIKTKRVSSFAPGEFYFNRDTNTIEMSCKSNDEVTLFSYLHELGHWMSDSLKQRPSFACLQNEFTSSSKTHKIALLEEEITAWNNGKKLAQKLGITLDNRKYETYKTQCLMTYINWISQ